MTKMIQTTKKTKGEFELLVGHFVIRQRLSGRVRLQKRLLYGVYRALLVELRISDSSRLQIVFSNNLLMQFCAANTNMFLSKIRRLPVLDW